MRFMVCQNWHAVAAIRTAVLPGDAYLVPSIRCDRSRALKFAEVRLTPGRRSDAQQAALWAAGDAGAPQSLTLTVSRTMRPPIFLLYELGGLYGTHKRYVRSVSWEQLSGQPVPASSLDMCVQYCAVLCWVEALLYLFGTTVAGWRAVFGSRCLSEHIFEFHRKVLACSLP